MLYFVAYRHKTTDAEGLHLLFSDDDDRAERTATALLSLVANDVRVIGAIDERDMAKNLEPFAKVPVKPYSRASFTVPEPPECPTNDDNPVKHHFMAAAALRYAALEYSDVLGLSRVRSLVGSAQKIEASLAEVIGL